jgi:glutathione S-transferase
MRDWKCLGAVTGAMSRAHHVPLTEILTMELYFSPGACLLSPHIVLRETGADFEIEQVNNQEKKTKTGKDYWTINPKGQVPCLELDDGETLTEGPVIVQYVADQKARPASPELRAQLSDTESRNGSTS